MTALIAPADVPEMPSIFSRPSSSRWSSTPQVKAPCAPPPCSARLMRFAAFGVSDLSPRERAREHVHHCAVQPPSIERLAPVIVAAASLHRNTAPARHARRLANCFVGCSPTAARFLDLALGHAARFGIVSGICFSTSGVEHLARADGVAGDAEVRGLERDGLGQADEAVLGGDVGDL